MRRSRVATASVEKEHDLLRQRTIVWRLISILLIAAATTIQIVRGESWLFLLVGQLFASIIWFAMPVLVRGSGGDPRDRRS